MVERLSGKELWEDFSEETGLTPMSSEELKVADNCVRGNRFLPINLQMTVTTNISEDQANNFWTLDY